MATRREVITKAMLLVDVFSAEEMEVFEKMLKTLDKKSSKPSKASLENIKVRNEILGYLTDGHTRTAKEIADELDYSTNKVAGLLRTMVADGKVEKVAGEKSKDAPKYMAIEGAEPYIEPKGKDA